MNHQDSMTQEDRTYTLCNLSVQRHHCKIQHDKQIVSLSQCHWDNSTQEDTKLVELNQPHSSSRECRANKLQLWLSGLQLGCMCQQGKGIDWGILFQWDSNGLLDKQMFQN